MGRLCVVGMGWHEEDGVAAGGNRVRRAELAEATSTRGSHTNQPAAIEPSDGSGTPWHSSVGILDYFFSLFLGSVSEDIHSRMGGSDVVPLYRFAIISESWGITFGEISTAGFSFL